MYSFELSDTTRGILALNKEERRQVEASPANARAQVKAAVITAVRETTSRVFESPELYQIAVQDFVAIRKNNTNAIAMTLGAQRLDFFQLWLPNDHILRRYPSAR